MVVVTVEVVVVVVVVVVEVEVIVVVATESIPLLNAEDLLSLQKLRLRDILVEELTRSPLLDQDTLPALARSSFGCPFCRAPQVL